MKQQKEQLPIDFYLLNFNENWRKTLLVYNRSTPLHLSLQESILVASELYVQAINKNNYCNHKVQKGHGRRNGLLAQQVDA